MPSNLRTLNFKTSINAPVKKVWDTMLADETYRKWTAAFNPGSYYLGSWEKGADIKFLGPSPNGNGEGGMVARIKNNILHKLISIEIYGYIANGVEDTASPEIKAWAPAYENYTFEELNGKTILKIDVDVELKYIEMFETMWPKALVILKELAEK